jgi:hypothetical protein
MSITFENDNDIIVNALEKVISFARSTQQIFVAQCIWWLASIIGLERELEIHISNLHGRTIVAKPVKIETGPSELPDRSLRFSAVLEEVLTADKPAPCAPKDTGENLRQDRYLKGCNEFLRESQRQQENLEESSIRESIQ